MRTNFGNTNSITINFKLYHEKSMLCKLKLSHILTSLN